MKRYDIEIFGSHMDIDGGSIAKIGAGKYRHFFGGSRWTVVDDEVIGNGPTLILTLDLADPRVSSLRNAQCTKLPLCFYLNCTGIGDQEYRIDVDKHQVQLTNKDCTRPEILSRECALPTPLPEKRIVLQDMDKFERPVSESAYWNCCDSFLGGDGVIRVLGPPVWLEWMEEHACRCGQKMEYVCSVGYEVDNPHRTLLDDGPFYPGEVAHYFFFCRYCLRLAVLLQSP